MGGVSQQIPLQQHLSDTSGPQLGQARRLQQGLSKLFQLNRVIGHGEPHIVRQWLGSNHSAARGGRIAAAALSITTRHRVR